ncbi:MAG: hybrid sensor histidine kinase/response regulator [Myxococcaceae bacterium]
MARSPQDIAVDAQCLRMSLERHLDRSIATTLSASVVAWVLSTWHEPRRLAAWVGLVTFINVLRISTWVWLKRSKPTDAQVLAHAPVYVVLMEAAALTWGVLVAWVGWPTDVSQIAVILVAIAGMMTGGVQSVSTTPRTMFASIAVSLTLVFVHMVTSTNPALRVLSLLIVGHVFSMVAAVRAVNRETRASIALRFENTELVQSLRIEKEREAAAREEAEKANREKSRFVAAASHDARQPLHAMGLLVDTLKSQELAPKATRLVQSIDVAHASLVSLHEGLLELSLAEVGTVVPRLVDAPLATLLETLETECGPRARQRGLQFDVRAVGVTLRTDPAMLLRVLRNLVTNSIAYTKQGRVLVTARRRAGECLLQVWDTGIGIAPEHQQKIFDELYQVGNAARDRTQGAGLGLAIVKRLATALKTEVTVKSTVGRGSVFSLVVPLAVETPRFVARGSGTVALVVDDDGLARAALATMLEQWGFEVVTASDAEEATGYVNALDRLDLVVSDLWLPGASGLDFLSKLAERPALKRVLMSGDTTLNPAKMTAEGITFVRKPVRAARLAEAIGGQRAN